MAEKACQGGRTLPVRTTEHMQQCQHCRTMVRDDLIDHPFFGFRAGCQGSAPQQKPNDG